MSEGSGKMMSCVVKEGEDGKEKPEEIGHSERMQQNYDEASRMMELTLSLCNNVFEGEDMDKNETLTRHSKPDSPESSKRLTVMSNLSSSQPGKTVLNVISSKFVSRRLGARKSECFK